MTWRDWLWLASTLALAADAAYWWVRYRQEHQRMRSWRRVAVETWRLFHRLRPLN